MRAVYGEGGVLVGYQCGGNYDRGAGRVTFCRAVSKSKGSRSFITPYEYAYKYLDSTGHLPFMPSDHADQTLEGRAGQLYRIRHGGTNWKKKAGYNPLPVPKKW